MKTRLLIILGLMMLLWGCQPTQEGIEVVKHKFPNDGVREHAMYAEFADNLVSEVYRHVPSSKVKGKWVVRMDFVETEGGNHNMDWIQVFVEHNSGPGSLGIQMYEPVTFLSAYTDQENNEFAQNLARKIAKVVNHDQSKIPKNNKLQ